MCVFIIFFNGHFLFVHRRLSWTQLIKTSTNSQYLRPAAKNVTVPSLLYIWKEN